MAESSRLERWGVACLLAVCLLVGLPVLLGQLSGDDPTIGPTWLWWTCYAGYFVLLALTLCGDGAEHLPDLRVRLSGLAVAG
ncbi:hypothetical protein ACFQ07_08700, partial [Actinomadura adrarensis]